MTGKSAVGNQTLIGEFQNDLSRIDATNVKHAIVTAAPMMPDATAFASPKRNATAAVTATSQSTPQKARPPP
jgi:hypothetical protein